MSFWLSDLVQRASIILRRDFFLVSGKWFRQTRHLATGKKLSRYFMLNIMSWAKINALMLFALRKSTRGVPIGIPLIQQRTLLWAWFPNLINLLCELIQSSLMQHVSVSIWQTLNFGLEINSGSNLVPTYKLVWARWWSDLVWQVGGSGGQRRADI